MFLLELVRWEERVEASANRIFCMTSVAKAQLGSLQQPLIVEEARQ